MTCGSDLLFGIITIANQPCVDLFGVVSTRAFYQTPKQGLYQGIQMSQSRIAMRLTGDQMMGRFAMNGVRSSGSGSYIGIDGESLVWQIQLAEMNYLWQENEHQIRFSGGINEDFWVKTNNEIWSLREISWGVAERQNSQSRADTGMSLLYNYKMIQAGVRMSSGEGMRRFERNTGLNTEGMFALSTSHLRLELYARDGSTGPSFASNHRLGSRISTKISDVTVAVEGLKNYGIQGDASRTPFYGSAFLLYQPKEFPLWGYGRVDILHEKIDVHGRRFMTGIGIPLQKYTTTGRIWMGWEGERLSEQMPLYAGDGTLLNTDTFFFQFTGNISTLFEEIK